MKVVLTGGGTAGHVFPAIHVGQYLQENHAAQLFFIGNPKHIEEKLAAEADIPFHPISSQGLEGNSFYEKYVQFVIQNGKGVKEAIQLLKKIKPDFVFATGGFVAAPVVTAAWILDIPYAVHEQNSVMGKVNKFASTNAKKVFYTFPVQESKKQTHTGIPIRFNEPLKENGDHLVFMGGSGGSVRLNEAAIEFAKKHPDIPVMLVSGIANYASCVSYSNKAGNPRNLQILDYVDNMHRLYEKTKVMVARSGAGSIFELANLSIPSILVPLPNSANNHQKQNALYFSEKDAAVLLEQKGNFEEALESEILTVWNDKSRQKQLKENMEAVSSRKATEIIAGELLKITAK